MYEMYVRLWKLGGANNFILREKKKINCCRKVRWHEKSSVLRNYTKGKQQIKP